MIVSLQFLNTCPASLPVPLVSGSWHVTYASRKWVQTVLTDLDEVNFKNTWFRSFCVFSLQWFLHTVFWYNHVLCWNLSFFFREIFGVNLGLKNTLVVFFRPMYFLVLQVILTIYVCFIEINSRSPEYSLKVIDLLASGRSLPIRKPLSSVFRRDLQISCMKIECEFSLWGETKSLMF